MRLFDANDKSSFNFLWVWLVLVYLPDLHGIVNEVRHEQAEREMGYTRAYQQPSWCSSTPETFS